MHGKISLLLERHRELKNRHRGYRVVISLLSIAAASYIGLCLVVLLLQGRMIYHPHKAITMTPATMLLEYEDVRLSSGAETLAAWFVPAKNARGTILFCHGNAGNLSDRVDSIDVFNRLGLDVFIFDYRGYGQSTGRPTEEGTHEDALAAWRYLTEERGKEPGKANAAPERIVIFGRSLGGAVAARLAGSVNARALIVESAFTGVGDLARDLFPWLPTRFIVRYGYRTIDSVRAVPCPVLVAHSPSDELIPYHHGRRLFDAAPEPRMFLEMSGGHNEGYILMGDRYSEGLDRFLTEVLGSPAPAR